MTPYEWFKSQGHGSQKKASIKMGYSIPHLNQVIHKKQPPSRYFIKCLSDYCGVQFLDSDFLKGCK